jgi:CO/xanthine dehydrogenase Mo-binding subunit
MQRVRVGATRDGRLVAIDHESTSTIGALDDGGVEPVTEVTGNAYSCRNVATHDRRARLHIPSPVGCVALSRPRTTSRTCRDRRQ